MILRSFHDQVHCPCASSSLGFLTTVSRILNGRQALREWGQEKQKGATPEGLQS
jgi:hypothetical protein